MKYNRKTFFTGYREIFGRLDQSEVDGLEFLLGKIESDPNWKSVQEVSYFLSTVDHETNHTFQPIKEIRERADSPRRANQDRYWLTGEFGRGFIQITWQKNYDKFGLGPDERDKALEPEMAYEIASRGMREGLFTGKKLSDYINEKKTDYHNARKIVNGLDQAERIAANARKFEAILSTASQNVIAEKPEKEPEKLKEPQVTTVPSNPPVVKVEPQKSSWTTKIAAAASAAGPVIAATGLKIGGVEFKTGGLIAFAAVAIVGMIVAAILYDRGQQRAQERLKISMENLANPNRQNVVAGGGES